MSTKIKLSSMYGEFLKPDFNKKYEVVKGSRGYGRKYFIKQMEQLRNERKQKHD